MTSRRWVAIGALSGAVTVALGAFGAHMLKDRVAPEQLAVWNTGVHYQGLHALALILFAVVSERWNMHSITAWCFAIGTTLFSGSLYALALGAPHIVGAITPFGGLAFIAGWLAFAWSARRAR